MSTNRCIGCNADLGESNPRQYCHKTHCPYICSGTLSLFHQNDDSTATGTKVENPGSQDLCRNKDNVGAIRDIGYLPLGVVVQTVQGADTQIDRDV